MLFQRITGFWVTQALAVAAYLGLADHFSDGPRGSDDLAHAVGAHPASLYRLLRALTSIDVVVEESPGQFRLTPLGACLRTTHPQSMRPAALFYGNPAVWGAWGNLVDGVRTGEPAFERVHGMGIWPYAVGMERCSPPCCARIPTCGVSSSTCRRRSAVPPRSWRPRAWRSGAR